MSHYAHTYYRLFPGIRTPMQTNPHQSQSRTHPAPNQEYSATSPVSSSYRNSVPSCNDLNSGGKLVSGSEFYLELTETNTYASKEIKKVQAVALLDLPQILDVDDVMDVSQLTLQASPRSQKPIKVKIMGYHNQMFLGMSTQIFELEVTDPKCNPVSCYEISRRFSDFADLYEQLFYNQPGYLLFPFPQKTLETFIKFKLGIAVESTHKSELIEHRITKLQLFANWVAEHSELRNSQQFAVFLVNDQAKLEEGKKRLNQIVEEHKKLEVGSHLKNLMGMGRLMIGSYFKSDKTQKAPRKVSEQFNNLILSAEQYIRQAKQESRRKLQQAQALLKAEKSSTQFLLLDTEFDILNKLCARHDSSRQLCKQYCLYLEFQFLERLNLQIRKIEEAEKCLLHRKEILEAIKSCNQGQTERKAKLQRIVQRLQRNFEADWPNFKQKFDQTIEEILNKFQVEWEIFKMGMRKLWPLQSAKPIGSSNKNNEKHR